MHFDQIFVNFSISILYLVWYFWLSYCDLIVKKIDSKENDCGLFAIAYAYLLLINEEPAICSIDQYSMRRLYNRFVTKDLLYMMFGYEQVDKQITGKSYKTFEIFLNWYLNLNLINYTH